MHCGVAELFCIYLIIHYTWQKEFQQILCVFFFVFRFQFFIAFTKAKSNVLYLC